MKLLAMLIFLLSFTSNFNAYSAPESYRPQECPVIGNTNSSIFHVPGQKSYAKMLRKNKRGDNRRCFKTEDEAKLASFRKAKR